MQKNKKVFQKIVTKIKMYLVIIAILMIIVGIYDKSLMIPLIVLYVLIILYTFWTNNKGQEELNEHINNVTFSLDKVAKMSMVNSPFPLIVADATGNVVFRNTKFKEEFLNIDVAEYIDKIVIDVKKEIDNTQSNEKKFKIINEIIIEDKNYKIYGEYMQMKDGYYMTINFVDITKIIELEDEINYKDTYIGILMVDNYEEIIQRISDEQKPHMIAKIEKLIYDWASDFDGLMVKNERDTFVCVFEKKYLDKIKKEKFNILDDIKKDNIHEKVQITFSIAISNDGNSNYEKYQTAQEALEIVLGRGGDQAVVRENEKYAFFGGRTEDIEKRTKVKARSVSRSLEELIKESNNVIIMGHKNSDIDCIGSAMGIYRMVKSLDKDPYIVLENYGVSLNNFIDNIKEDQEYNEVIISRNQALSIIDKETLLIVVDTHKITYVEVPELLEKTEKIVIIDHHRRSTDYIENAIITFQEVYASSAAELVTEIIEHAEIDIKLKTIEAEALYTAIMMDTKIFTFKTGVRTFEAAAFLRKCGVDIIKVKKWFQSDLETYNKISSIVSEAEVVYDSIAISMYKKEDDEPNIVCAKAADELLTISNITASFVMGIYKDKVFISGRSIGDINVQVILEKLGGGGHITLAGAQVEGMSIEDVKDSLIKIIHEYFMN